MPRRSMWHDSPLSMSVTSGAQNEEDLWSETDADMRGHTVVRVIINVDLASTTVSGAWGTQLVDLGIGMISTEAIGASVFPDPNIDSERPQGGWMYRTRRIVAQNGTGTPVVYTVGADIRSARKVDQVKLFLIVNNNVNRGTSFAIDVSGMIRVLSLMP